MKTDQILQKDVQDSLNWEPQLKTADIGVIARDGIVTLTGTVDNYYIKAEAEKVAKKVNGVKALVEKITVKPNPAKSINDTYIAEKILELFRSSFSIPDERIFVFVEKGWVTLQGQVNWNYQKEAAKNVVAGLIGVCGITNNITTKSDRKDALKKNAIEKAISDNAALQDDKIQVTVKDSDVTLSGLVKTFFEKEEAERIAWNAPGIWSVSNEIGVDSFL
jgi:osmotically-inducible protein OsmY